jgi:protein transport protein SEC61 subunit gamma-like protein
VLNLWNEIINLPKTLKEKFSEYRRVMTIARKPDKDEFIKLSKICGLGILLVGGIGFIIYILAILLLK